MMKSAIYMILLLNLYLMATAYPKRSVESSVSRFKRSGVNADLTVDVNGKRVIDVSHPKINPLKLSEKESVSEVKRSGAKVDLTVDVNGKRVIDVSHPKNNPLISNLQSRGRGITLKFGFILKWPTRGPQFLP